MFNSKRISLVLALTGALVLALAWYNFRKPSTNAAFRLRLAWVEKNSGQVSIFRNGYAQKETVERRTALFNLESIETGNDSEALIVFDSLWQIKIAPQSRVTVESVDDAEDSHLVLLVKRGQITIHQFGRDGELFIAKNGQRVPAQNYPQSQLFAAPIEKPELFLDETTTASAADVLNEKEISEVIQHSRSAFFKCYTALLQRSPEVKGQIGLSITIESSGKTSGTEITAPATFDPEFRQCAQTVAQRLIFRSFQGPSVATFFPLIFE